MSSPYVFLMDEPLAPCFGYLKRLERITFNGVGVVGLLETDSGVGIVNKADFGIDDGDVNGFRLADAFPAALLPCATRCSTGCAEIGRIKGKVGGDILFRPGFRPGINGVDYVQGTTG